MIFIWLRVLSGWRTFFVALRRETASRASLLKGQTIGAIHFGGGTPSMASPSLLGSWLEQVASLASFAPDMEIALEANPEDLKGSAANEFHQAGVNRLSLGVQSFSPEKLSSLAGRILPGRQWLLPAMLSGCLTLSVWISSVVFRVKTGGLAGRS